MHSSLDNLYRRFRFEVGISDLTAVGDITEMLEFNSSFFSATKYFSVQLNAISLLAAFAPPRPLPLPSHFNKIFLPCNQDLDTILAGT